MVVRAVAPSPPTRRIYAVFRAGGLRSPATAAMVELLHEACADRGRAAA